MENKSINHYSNENNHLSKFGILTSSISLSLLKKHHTNVNILCNDISEFISPVTMKTVIPSSC